VADPIQSNPVACDCEFVASVTNEALQLPWCGASGDAGLEGGSVVGRDRAAEARKFLEKSPIDVLCRLLACS
jgi:hypothetical protein